MTTFKAYLNKDLVDIFTNRFETLRTFLTEVVGTKLTAFVMSVKLTETVGGLSKMNDALIDSMNMAQENWGSNAERIQYAVRILNEANNDLATEVIGFVRGSVTSFIDRFSAIEGTEVYAERKLRFANELRLYRENIAREGITADLAIKAYGAMESFVSWLEGLAQREISAAENARSVAQRVKEVLTAAPAKRRTKPRNYVGKGEKRQSTEGKGEKKAKKQKSGKSRHQQAAA
jgi:hypothetical protein